jgi:hypothetical protein
MKKIIFLAIGVTALYQVAKYFKIDSWSDLVKVLSPKMQELKSMIYN